ncbi:phosphatidylinositol-specific phospholipase C1-like protein [Sphingobium sp. AS12]|nr:phosphatidylinositol-specific phospholipase C1-like protein [Sphingobium sp. AS12]
MAIFQARRDIACELALDAAADQLAIAIAGFALTPDISEIRDAVRKGYLVSTRADIDTVDARQGTNDRRDAALASGAQIISTDYLTAPNIYGNGYHLAPFSGAWRRNSVVRRCPR